MASGGAEEEDGGIALDIDNVHMLLQVEHEQIQKRTFTNWINAQLSKRSPPSFVSDLFSDLRDGSQLLDLLEVMSGQTMKRQKGRGVFQQRANIEAALNFLKKKSVKLVNINVSDIVDGRPSIVLGLIWTIILHCHIEELASTLSFSSCHSSLDSLVSLDSWSGSPVPASPVPLPPGRTSPLHRRFRVSAKKALLMWVREQCQRVGCSISVRDFKSSWRSGEVFLAILCSLRPQLVDLSLVQSRSNQENLEEAFHLAERELHIPRLLEPQDVDVNSPEEKSIMTYVAQFLQYSSDMPAPDDHLQLFPVTQPPSISPVSSPAPFTPAVAVSPLRQVSQSERAVEVTSWLQQACQELSEARAATEKASFAEKYQVFQNLTDNITEQRRPVMTLLAATRRRPELGREQLALRTAWDHLEEELQRCNSDLDLSLPPPLDTVVAWLQRAEAALSENEGGVSDHAEAAKQTRTQQDTLQTLTKEMSHHVSLLETFHNVDDVGNILVPLQKFEEIKRRLTHIRVTAKYQGIKLEYQESRHTVLDLLGRVRAKVQTWKAPYTSQEAVTELLQDWHESVERQDVLLILMHAVETLKERAKAYTSKAALGEGSQRVGRQVKALEGEAEQVSQTVRAAKAAMERTVSAWETYSSCLAALQTWLEQKASSQASPAAAAAAAAQDAGEWTSCQAKLNEAGNSLIEVTDSSTSLALAEQLGRVNLQWAECVKRTTFEVPSHTTGSPLCLQMVHSLAQEIGRLLNQPLEVSTVPLKASRQKLQLLSKKVADVDLSSLSAFPDFERSHAQQLEQMLPQMLAEAERACGELHRAASRLEGRLAELQRWSSEALDYHQHLKDKKHRRRSALEPNAKGLVSRGLHLQSQVAAEGQDLQDLITGMQRTSPLHHLSMSSLQDRVTEAVSHSQEILALYGSPGSPGSPGSLQHGEKVQNAQHDAGSVVVARTKHISQVGTITLQVQDPSQVSAVRSPQGWQGSTQEEGSSARVLDVHIRMLPRPLEEPGRHVQAPLVNIVKEAQQGDRPSPALTQTPTPKPPPLSKDVRGPLSELQESSSHAQTHSHRSDVKKSSVAQSSDKPPRPPVMVRSEVHSKARSMARSRLEKARSRLQGRIQQAIKMFGGRDVSEPQVKRKQRALKLLQPAFLDEFLAAVEGLGAFCTGPQLQDLTLLCDTVRKQWEDVRREMASFVSVLRSELGDEGPKCPVVRAETQTNTLHEATDHTDLASVPLPQAALKDSASVEESVDSLEELCETLGERAEQRSKREDEQKTRASDILLPADSGGQLRGGDPLGATGALAHAQQSSTAPVCGSAWVLPGGGREGGGGGGNPQPPAQDVPQKKLKPSLRATEQKLKARVLHLTQSNQQPQLQAIVRGNTVETKQEAEWTVITEAQDQHRPKHRVLQRMTSAERCADPMESAGNQAVLVPEKLDLSSRQSAVMQDDSAPRQEHPTPCRMEEEAGEEAKRSQLKGDEETKMTKGEEEHKVHTGMDISEAKGPARRRRSHHKKEESCVRRRAALLGSLKEIQGAAEELGLQEASLPALQHRARALTELDSRLSGLLPELKLIREASSQPGASDQSHTREELEDVWEEATKAVAERLEQCGVLAELLRRFQSLHMGLSGTLQRAESTVSEQASYMGRDNLQRRHTMVTDMRAELQGLGDAIEEVRGVCRQLHAHLRLTAQHTAVPFEGEAEALMDRWLDISERTDCCIENLHLGLTLWDGVLQLGAEVESWTENKLAAFAQCPSAQTEENIRALQNEIAAQGENMERFHKRASEIQVLLQSAEPPLELQVVESQMRKKIEQLRELVSEAEDVYRQTVAAKGQITARMAECSNSLRQIHSSLITLSGSDVQTILAKLKDLLVELHTQDEQAESVLEDVRVVASIAGVSSLESLNVDGAQLQEQLTNTHQLFSEVEAHAERSIQAFDRLRRESQHLEQWLQDTEPKAVNEENISILQQELLQQRPRIEAVDQLISSLKSGALRQCVLVEESSRLLQRCSSFQSNILHGSMEKQGSHQESESCAGTQRQVVGSSFGQALGIQSCAERRIHGDQGVCSGLEEGVCNEEHSGRLLKDCQHKLTSLQDTASACQAQPESSAGLSTDVPAPESPDLLQIVRSSTTEVHIRQVANLQNHQGALDGSSRNTPQVEKEVSSAENACESSGHSSDARQLKEEWHTIQACDTRASHLLKTGEQPPTHAVQTTDAVVRALDQAALHEGSSHQRALPQELPERDLLLRSLGSRASDAVSESAALLEGASTSLVPDLSSLDETMAVCPSSSPTLSATNNKESFEKNCQMKPRDALEKTQEDMTEPSHEGTTSNQDSALVPNDANHPTAQSEASKVVQDLQEDEKPFKGFGVTPKKVFTITLDIERPEFLPLAKQQREDAGASIRPDPITCLPREISSTTFIGPESDSKIPCLQSLASNESPVAESLPERALESEEERPTSAKLSREEKSEAEQANHLEHSGSRLTEEAGRGESEPKQQQSQGGMEPGRTALVSAADLPAGRMTGVSSTESHTQACNMLDIFSEILPLVERSNIINRAPHVDLNWYLKSSPGEPEIRLVRTVQKVLACRYRPALLDISAMAKQLQEAEGYRCCVQEQVAALKSASAASVCHPDVLSRVEGQWSAALLDASATVQVKAAQLDQVRQYHKQMKLCRAFLEVLAAERDKMSLDVLGSSALQADKLQALLKTMVLKKATMEELLHSGGQLSVHLSDAESSGALLAQLGDVQEEWRLLEGSIKRALQHAANSTSQSSLLVTEAEQLKAKLQALQTSHCQGHGSKSALELAGLRTDLKLYNQLYLHLQSQADALVHFSLGQKEKDAIRCSLQEVSSLLDLTKGKLDASASSCEETKISKKLHDLIIWAKQAENHISMGKTLALFPEEARVQIAEMRKFQTDICSQRSKMKGELDHLKDEAPDKEKGENEQVLKTVEDLYDAIADSLDQVLDTMKKNLRERERLLCQLASMDAWLAETHAKRGPRFHIDNVSKADVRRLESELQSHRTATLELESQVKQVEAMAESCKLIAVGLSPGESRYLVNRLSGLWTELDGLLALEKASSWELEELIHERKSSDEELSNIQASLQRLSSRLEQQHFPLTQETVSTVERWKHMLMEHQWEVQELQHCQEAKRSPLLCTIGELQDQCKALSAHAFEQDKYLHLRRQMEESRGIAEDQIQHAKDKAVRLGERFRLCQTLLVELPLVKTQCQEAADQLEAIAQELSPPELDSERGRIRSTVETLVSWESSVTDDIADLEAKLLLGLRFPAELRTLTEFFCTTRAELEGDKPINPDEKAVDVALRRYWVIWRNMESAARVLECLARKEKVNLKSHEELYSLRDAAKRECQVRMESLSQARESLKDYQWAAQGAIGFLHHAEATFLSAPGGFLDCTEEQQQTQQALEALEDGFQAHISHLTELLPQQACLSRADTEQLHTSILSQLLVGRAVLEAQAQLRLETLQRCEVEQQSHRKCHEDLRQRLSRLEAQLSKCAGEQVASFDKCVAQQKQAKRLMEDLRSLAAKMEELWAGCPMQGCGVGKDGELGALWRRWVSLRRGVGLLMAHAEQRGEEWKDITTSMEQCCSFLASLQADVPDSSTVSFTVEEPQELLAQAEMHQAELEQEQQALASLEHRLEHALSLSSSQDSTGPRPVGKTLVKIQENVRSLKERNLQVVAAAQAEEKERQQVQEEIAEVEQSVSTVIAMLESCPDPRQQQELRADLSSLKAKLKHISDTMQSRYAEVPADISRRLQQVQLSLRKEEEKLMERISPVGKLDGKVAELASGLEKVTALLEQRSATVDEAQHVLKRVWDELDAWHGRLMLLDNEVQDLAEEHPDQAHLLLDRLTRPLQLYQDAAQRAEQRTAFLGKIPACLQDFEGIVYSATCWLDESRSWFDSPCSFTTARSLQNHAKSLQLVLDDSERIKHTLQDYRPVLAEISALCDMRVQEETLDRNIQRVQKMQQSAAEPLEQLLHTVEAVETVEAELKTMERNVPKIRAILSSMDVSNITVTELAHNRQVVLANVESMRRTLEEMERCTAELRLPQGAGTSLLIFPRARMLLQQLGELEQLTQHQAALLENKMREEAPGVPAASAKPPQRHLVQDPEETLNSPDGEREDAVDTEPQPEVQAALSSKPAGEAATPGLEDKRPETFHPESLSMESIITAEQFPAAAASLLGLCASPAREGLATVQHEVQEPPEEPTRHVEAEDDRGEQQSWSRLHSRICHKVTALKKVWEELQSPEEGGRWEKLISSGSAAAALQQTHKSISALRRALRTVSCGHSSQPGVSEELLQAAGQVLLCLDALTEPVLTPAGAAQEDAELRLLQQECLMVELATVAGLLRKAESDTRAGAVPEEQQALSSLTSLQDGLDTLQLLCTRSCQQLAEHQGVTFQQQELPSSWLCDLGQFELGQLGEMFPSVEDTPSLEQCVLGRHLRQSPEAKAQLQRAVGSLLRGITRLLELGEESMTEGPTRQVQSGSQLQAALCRPKKLLQVLSSQLAFVQHLCHGEPEALRCQEEERVQLEVRATGLHKQAVEQELAAQRWIQAWTRWEDGCGRLGRSLDDVEAFLSSSWDAEGDGDEAAQSRQDGCQRALLQLDESRPALGAVLDAGRELQSQPQLAASVSQAGGALELRWLSARRRTEAESRRCAQIRDSWARFQTDFASASEWLSGASRRLQTWSHASDSQSQRVHSHLIQILDFTMEAEAVSVRRASAAREAARLLHLREAHCPSLRARLCQLEAAWSQLTSDLPKAQERLQQRLLAAWPPDTLLSDLEEWLKKLETALSQQREAVAQAKDAAQISATLQRYQELKAGLVNGQLLLDFLCQTGPQAVGLEVQARREEHTSFAERLGALGLQWLHVHRELQSQIGDGEQMYHACAGRERRLQRLRGWVARLRQHLDHSKQPTGQTLARKALLEQEAVAGRASEAAAALRELTGTRARAEKDEDHPCDACFSGQAQSVFQACADLSQQLEALRPALQQTVEEWERFDGDLAAVSLQATRLRCALQPQPLCSAQQAAEHARHLELLQEQVLKGKELWAHVEKSYQHLVPTLHHGAVEVLDDRVKRERERWEEVVRELRETQAKAEETVSLWREYAQRSDRCCLQLQALRERWEALSSSAQQQARAQVHSVEDAAQALQSSVGDVLAASKPLTRQLEPPAAHLIQSETRLLSRDVLLLGRAAAAKKRSLEEDLEQQTQLHTRLEQLEKQMHNIRNKVTSSLDDAESAEVLQELGCVFASLADVGSASGCAASDDGRTERLRALSRHWADDMTHVLDASRELQAERQRSHSFEDKCRSLMSVQSKLEEESKPLKLKGYSSLQEMLMEHQRLEAETFRGHQLLHGLLRHAVESTGKETAERRAELTVQVRRARQGWLGVLALVARRRSLIRAHLGQWSVLHCGLKLLQKLLRDVDALLPPAGPALCALHRPRSCTDHCQDALALYSSVYTRTLEAGRQVCEAMTESEQRAKLQAELQGVRDDWERSSTLLGKRRDLVNSTTQKWAGCQEEISRIQCELVELGMKLQQQQQPGSEHEHEIQETELSLQRAASGLWELATMKTDLSQYVAAGDSALLEQQLEQLHGQWEELCVKVSLRRQEIADRLNAWTIFNDKNREFCDWLTQMENKVCHSGDLSIEEMVEKLKKDCMEEINLFSENKSHLKQLGEQLLLASDEAKQAQAHGSLLELSQRWHSLFSHIEARVKKLKETLVTMQQLDKNMSNLRSWLSRMEAELSRPITYSVCHHQEIQRRLAEQQELQRDIEQHTEGVASVLSLCDVLLRDEDAAGGSEAESDSLQETSSSLDQRWRTICAMALDRRLRIEETWRLWCKFLDDYSRFEDWLKMAERTAANPNSADVLYTVAREELKKFEGFQRQVHERLTQLELVNNQYRRLARENRTDRASQLKAMVHEGNRRWDRLHRRVAAVLRRLKYFTSQREEFEGTRESMLVWLTELDLQLTNVEHFSESDVHHKIQQLNSFQREITVNTERIDGLIVFGEGLIQKSSPQDAALIEDELEELHSYCQEVFSRLVRFHQRLSQPPIKEEPELSFSLESSLELIGRPWLGRSQSSLPATPTHLLASPLERSGRETPVSVDSLPLEWDHTGDVGGSSSHEDDEEEEEDEDEERAYFSALSEGELSESQEEFVEAPEAEQASSPASSRSLMESPRWRSAVDAETRSLQLDSEGHAEAPPTLTSTPLKQGYLQLMSQCSGSIENIKRVSLILDDEEQPEELGLTGLSASDKQSGVIERWELLRAQSRSEELCGPHQPQQLSSELDDISAWLEEVIPELEHRQRPEPAACSIQDMAARARELKEMQKMFTRYKPLMLSVNLRAQEAPELQDRLTAVNRDWSRACTDVQQWDTRLRGTLLRCQEFHEALHCLLLWLAHAESRRYAVDLAQADTPLRALRQHRSTLTELREELQARQAQQASLQALWSQLQPEEPEEQEEKEQSNEAREKLHVTGSKLKQLLRQVDRDLSALHTRLDCESASDDQSAAAEDSQKSSKSKQSPTERERRDASPPRSFFSRVLRAAFPLHLLFLFLLLLPCLIPLSESEPGCTGSNNFARSLHPMLRYTNGPPPT